MESGSETVSTSLADAVRRILAYRVPEGQPAILHLYRTPEKRLAEQRKKYLEAKAKLATKNEHRLRGYCPDTDLDQERKLRSIALKGGTSHSVVRLFNEVTKAQGDTKREEAALKRIRNGDFHTGERFKRKMKRLEGSLSEGRKIVKYDSIVAPKWDALRDTLTQ